MARPEVDDMKLPHLALCLALVLVPGATLLPVASACCIHSSHAVAWAAYAVTDEGVLCASPSAQGVGDACELVSPVTHFRVVLVDAAGAVPFVYDACGERHAAVGTADVVLPGGCVSIVVTPGIGASAGVIQRANYGG